MPPQTAEPGRSSRDNGQIRKIAFFLGFSHFCFEMSSNSVHPQNSIENASDSKKIQESRTKEKEELLARKKAFEERLFGRTGMVENRQLMKRKDFNQLYEKLINEVSS